MRLFALKYYRKMINSNKIHFMKEKKKAQLRIKDHLGPFVCNNREARQAVEEILKRMNLKKSFICPYDPYSFIL